MALKPESSIIGGLALASVVYGVYSQATPTIADIRTAPPNDPDIASARKLAAFSTAAVVGGVSLIAQDKTMFIMGAAMIVMLDWWHRHANLVDPATARATAPMIASVSTQMNDADDYGYTGDVYVTE